MSVSEAWSSALSDTIDAQDTGEAASSSEQSLLAQPGPASGSTFAASLERHSTGLPVSISSSRPTASLAVGSLPASKPVSIASGPRRQPRVVSSPSSTLPGLDSTFEPPHELLARTLPQELNFLGEPMTFKPGSSVVEGRGSKLQGQAQRRFRAAIMRQTGFLEQDPEAREAHKLQKEREASAPDPVEAY